MLVHRVDSRSYDLCCGDTDERRIQKRCGCHSKRAPAPTGLHLEIPGQHISPSFDTATTQRRDHSGSPAARANLQSLLKCVQAEDRLRRHRVSHAPGANLLPSASGSSFSMEWFSRTQWPQNQCRSTPEMLRRRYPILQSFALILIPRTLASRVSEPACMFAGSGPFCWRRCAASSASESYFTVRRSTGELPHCRPARSRG